MRPLTPAEKAHQDLRRADVGVDGPSSAPVQRQGPKGKICADETHVPEKYDGLPSSISDGPGFTGDSGEWADGLHEHGFDLTGLDIPEKYEAVAQPVVPGLGAIGDSEQWSDGKHQHPFDPDGAGLALDPHGDEAHDVPYTPASTFTAHSGETETAHGADVNATPNAIARRNAAGQVVAAPSTADGHAIVHEQATVNAAANAIARRNAAGQTETADATAAAHAIPMGQADTRYGTGVTLAADLIAESDPGTDWGEGLRIMPATTGAGYPANGVLVSWRDATTVHQAHMQDGFVTQRHRSWNDGFAVWSSWVVYAQQTAVDGVASDLADHEVDTTSAHGASITNVGSAIVRRDPAGDIFVTRARADVASLSNGATALRFADSSDSGLQHDGSGALGLIANGDGVVLSDTDFRPRTASTSLDLGTASRPWQQGQFADVIETTHSDAGGPSILAGGSIEAGDNLVADMSSGGVFGSLVSTQMLTSLSDGTQVTIDPKSSSVRVFRVGVGYRPIEASAFTVNSDRTSKRDIRDDDRDALADVLATPVCRYRLNARKVRPVGASPYGEQSEPEVLDEYEDDAEHVGLVADEAPDDVRAAMGEGEGISLYAMCSKLWRAVQQQQEQIEELRARLA